MESVDYLDFENQFRGDRDSISKKFIQYDQLIDILIQNNTSPLFVDIGSGRGEWIEFCSSKAINCTGIENNSSMVDFCRSKNLSVLQGNAIDCLTNFEEKSVDVITIFHVVEHLIYSDLIKLLSGCRRALKDNGVLIIETPSIDNLIVSTNTFYLDHTHITHINPDSFNFLINKLGFYGVSNFYINGGPLQDTDHNKITRILNGVAQDIVFIVTNDKYIYSRIFTDDTKWQSDFTQAITTLQAAVDFDLKNIDLFNDQKKMTSLFQEQFKIINTRLLSFENQHELIEQQKDLINNLKEEIIYLKLQLKHFLKLLKLLKILFRPFLQLYRYSRRNIKLLLKKIIIIVFQFKFIKTFLLSSIGRKIIVKILILFPFLESIISLNEFNLKIYKLNNLSKKNIRFNRSLTNHHHLSSRSQDISNYILKKLKNIK